MEAERIRQNASIANTKPKPNTSAAAGTAGLHDEISDDDGAGNDGGNDDNRDNDDDFDDAGEATASPRRRRLGERVGGATLPHGGAGADRGRARVKKVAERGGTVRASGAGGGRRERGDSQVRGVMGRRGGLVLMNAWLAFLRLLTVDMLKRQRTANKAL